MDSNVQVSKLEYKLDWSCMISVCVCVCRYVVDSDMLWATEAYRNEWTFIYEKTESL